MKLIYGSEIDSNIKILLIGVLTNYCNSILYTNMKSQIDYLKNKVTTIIDEIKNTTDDLVSAIDTLDSKISRIETTIDDIQSTAISTDKSIDRIELTVDTMQSTINEIDNEVGHNVLNGIDMKVSILDDKFNLLSDFIDISKTN